MFFCLESLSFDVQLVLISTTASTHCCLTNSILIFLFARFSAFDIFYVSLFPSSSESRTLFPGKASGCPTCKELNKIYFQTLWQILRRFIFTIQKLMCSSMENCSWCGSFHLSWELMMEILLPAAMHSWLV